MSFSARSSLFALGGALIAATCVAGPASADALPPIPGADPTVPYVIPAGTEVTNLDGSKSQTQVDDTVVNHVSLPDQVVFFSGTKRIHTTPCNPANWQSGPLECDPTRALTLEYIINPKPQETTAAMQAVVDSYGADGWGFAHADGNVYASTSPTLLGSVGSGAQSANKKFAGKPAKGSKKPAKGSKKPSKGKRRSR